VVGSRYGAVVGDVETGETIILPIKWLFSVSSQSVALVPIPFTLPSTILEPLSFCQEEAERSFQYERDSEV
jgi:hypothetical protein